MEQELLGKRVSQSHFYATLASLRGQGLIQKYLLRIIVKLYYRSLRPADRNESGIAKAI